MSDSDVGFDDDAGFGFTDGDDGFGDDGFSDFDASDDANVASASPHADKSLSFFLARDALSTSRSQAISLFLDLVDHDAPPGEWSLRALAELVHCQVESDPAAAVVCLRRMLPLVPSAAPRLLSESLLLSVLDALLAAPPAEELLQALHETVEVTAALSPPSPVLALRSHLALATLLRSSGDAPACLKELAGLASSHANEVDLLALRAMALLDVCGFAPLRQAIDQAQALITAGNVPLPRSSGFLKLAEGILALRTAQHIPASQLLIDALSTLGSCRAPDAALAFKALVLNHLRSSELAADQRVDVLATAECRPFLHHPELSPLFGLVAAYDSHDVPAFLQAAIDCAPLFCAPSLAQEFDLLRTQIIADAIVDATVGVSQVPLQRLADMVCAPLDATRVAVLSALSLDRLTGHLDAVADVLSLYPTPPTEFPLPIANAHPEYRVRHTDAIAMPPFEVTTAHTAPFAVPFASIVSWAVATQ
jgi:hypothetical protein